MFQKCNRDSSIINRVQHVFCYNALSEKDENRVEQSNTVFIIKKISLNVNHGNTIMDPELLTQKHISINQAYLMKICSIE